MPFTAAHPLAIAPLVRVRWLDATCLVIGSMAPDFEYFLRGQQITTISHTLRGLVLFDLPITLALAAVFHAVVKWPLVVIAPAAIARRLIAPARRGWAVLPGALAALVGSATHLGWDAFTHAQGWGAKHYRGLKQPIALPVVGPMALHRVLLHASTVIGLVGVAILVARALRRQPPVALPSTSRVAPRLIFAGCIAGLAALAIHRALGLGLDEPSDVITAAIAGGLAGVIVASALTWRRARHFASAAR